MKVFNKSEFRLSKLSVCVCSSLFLLSLSYSAEPASCSSSDGQTLICTVKGGIGSWGERIPSIMSGEYGLMNTYDFVEIDASGSAVAAGGVGPRGYGIYVDYSGVLTSKTLLITTNGSGADGIRVNKGEYDFTVAGKLTINSKGTSGDGINVANSNNAGSRVFITGEQAYIESKGGIGVRANLTSNARGNEVHLAKNATIVTLGTGSNTYAGTGIRGVCWRSQ
ncbi:Uncharacterised protein [Leminorella richardii]|uniref:Uncharacterized protein n=1 Tax=Leminorella richardii TaxID=158841 RepID=A0A2X4XIS9_9GAMM|nr:hypothetical protein [Leminorella richardii]SQI36514.1 Uncharacterised protein [Leminorella richardii]